MKKPRFSDRQIVAIIKPYEAGVPVAELSREHNVNTALPVARLVRGHERLADGD